MTASYGHLNEILPRIRGWLHTGKAFLRSKAGEGLQGFLIFSAVLSAGLAYQFYHTSLEAFRAQKADEQATAFRLVDAFVTEYSGLRAQLGAPAPVPATFRAHSIEAFNKQVGTDNKFLLRWVGRQGRQITTPPADAEMASTIEAFASVSDPKPKTTLASIDGKLVLRTVYPSLARACLQAPSRARLPNSRMGA